MQKSELQLTTPLGNVAYVVAPSQQIEFYLIFRHEQSGIFSKFKKILSQ
jgi:hypothetical protein